MEANDFVARLKADISEKYNCDIRKVTVEYKLILDKIPTKDRGLFGLNVLRTLCWNLDKAPKWRESIDNANLLTLAVDCFRETRALDKDDRVKTLACIYHLHKHAVRLNKPIRPELVLKVSYLPFELDTKHLFKEYNKTYWNILSDRLSYIERLKTKVNIRKLLPKLTEDIKKVIQIYDSTQFCSAIIVYLVKKLHLLYSDSYAKDLSETFKEIFTALAEKEDLKLFKELTDKENFDMFNKLNDCLYIIADNSMKLSFKDCIFDEVIHTCVAMVGHSLDLFHCLQTVYLNFFCCITSGKTNVTYIETILSSLQNSLETTEKLGYTKAIYAMYPYLNQLLRLYIENQISPQTNADKFSLKTQEECLKLILFLMQKLKVCVQILKCENCPMKSGLHDALRLSFLIKHFITISISKKIVLTTMFDTLKTIIIKQYVILTELKKLGCVNYQKLFRKLQTDVHNCAIALNKAQYYEFSIKLFDIYLQNEIKCTEIDSKNVCRAFFNKSICELDCKLYEAALIDAFLSLVFSQPEGLKTDKYMSLVMDIKAKELKSKAEDDEETDSLQLISVLDACKMAAEKANYRDLKPFMKEVKFSVVLHHEFSMYSKLWPSIAPVGGVWRALLNLSTASADGWISVEDKGSILGVLYDVVLETPSVVRTIHSPHYSTIVKELLNNFENMHKCSSDEKAVHAALLFIQCEYDLAEASQRYEWKTTDCSMNPDQLDSYRTVAQEHAASTRAIAAVRLLADLLPQIQKVSLPRLRFALQIYEIFVTQLLLLSRDAPALQLAYICCQIADALDDHETYVRNAGVLASSCPPSPPLSRVMEIAARKAASFAWGETRLVFLCDVALHYISAGKTCAAARLVRLAQEKIIHTMQTQPELNWGVAVGRLLEAQTLLCQHSDTGASELTAVNAVLKNYLALTTTGAKWSWRRLRVLTVRRRSLQAARGACCVSRALGLAARARATAAAALPSASAIHQATLHSLIVDVASFNDAMIKIDMRLKRILGLYPSDETHLDSVPALKQPQFTPKPEVETMRDVRMIRKNHADPNLPWESVGAFKIPEFYHHNIKCACYACEVPACVLLSYRTSSIEAAAYAFANEHEIARNYYEGVLDMTKIADAKFKQLEHKYKEIYEEFIAKAVVKGLIKEFKTVQIESLIDMAFFELKCKNICAADGYIVEIHEIVQECGQIDHHLWNEVTNLMAASARLKQGTKNLDLDLDEFENLNLSPSRPKDTVMLKTPERRPSQPPKQDKKIVTDEEVPKKRLIIKQMKLDEDDDDDDFEKSTKKQTRKTKTDAFKVPNLKLPKPVLEEATPRPSRSIPRLKVTQPSQRFKNQIQKK